MTSLLSKVVAKLSEKLGRKVSLWHDRDHPMLLSLREWVCDPGNARDFLNFIGHNQSVLTSTEYFRLMAWLEEPIIMDATPIKYVGSANQSPRVCLSYITVDHHDPNKTHTMRTECGNYLTGILWDPIRPAHLRLEECPECFSKEKP